MIFGHMQVFTPPTKDTMVRCPKYTSTQFVSNKGFGLGKAVVGGLLLVAVGLLGGLVGSEKTTVTCLKCGAGKK